MTVKIDKSGTNIIGSLLSFEYHVDMCSGIGTLNLRVEDKTNISFSPWEEIKLYNDGNLKGTFYTGNVSEQYPSGTKRVECQDNSKRLTDYFISQNWKYSYHTTAKFWIKKILDEVGVSYQFQYTDSDGAPIQKETEVGLDQAYNLLAPFLQQSGWYFYIDPNGVAVIGDVIDSNSTNYSINDSNILDIGIMQTDDQLRNRALVWGAGLSSGSRVIGEKIVSTDWQRDANDQRTTVIAHPGITESNKQSILDNIIDEFSEMDDIIDLTIDGFHNAEIGDIFDINSNKYGTLKGFVSNITKSMSNKGLITQMELNKKCPRLFAFVYDWTSYSMPAQWVIRNSTADTHGYYNWQYNRARMGYSTNEEANNSGAFVSKTNPTVNEVDQPTTDAVFYPLVVSNQDYTFMVSKKYTNSADSKDYVDAYRINSDTGTLETTVSWRLEDDYPSLAGVTTDFDPGTLSVISSDKLAVTGSVYGGGDEWGVLIIFDFSTETYSIKYEHKFYDSSNGDTLDTYDFQWGIIQEIDGNYYWGAIEEGQSDVSPDYTPFIQLHFYNFQTDVSNTSGLLYWNYTYVTEEDTYYVIEITRILPYNNKAYFAISDLIGTSEADGSWDTPIHLYELDLVNQTYTKGPEARLYADTGKSNYRNATQVGSAFNYGGPSFLVEYASNYDDKRSNITVECTDFSTLELIVDSPTHLRDPRNDDSNYDARYLQKDNNVGWLLGEDPPNEQYDQFEHLDLVNNPDFQYDSSYINQYLGWPIDNGTVTNLDDFIPVRYYMKYALTYNEYVEQDTYDTSQPNGIFVENYNTGDRSYIDLEGDVADDIEAPYEILHLQGDKFIYLLCEDYDIASKIYIIR